ncbi:hypothetical protein U9M48_025155 [Paspalum notatum var. saurae]|uniref:Uncharacterized protein n=1 Tax=Paspalum notatum var. saurae TaxID=547442 RepID=A0AAQ3TPT0_PASNO
MLMVSLGRDRGTSLVQELHGEAGKDGGAGSRTQGGGHSGGGAWSDLNKVRVSSAPCSRSRGGGSRRPSARALARSSGGGSSDGRPSALAPGAPATGRGFGVAAAPMARRRMITAGCLAGVSDSVAQKLSGYQKIEKRRLLLKMVRTPPCI